MTGVLAILIVAAFSITIILIARGSNITAKPYFDGWKEVFAARRDTRDDDERLLFWIMLAAQTLRTILYGGVISVLVAAWMTAAAVCGVDWFRALEHVRRILLDFYHFLRGTLPPPAPAP